MRIIFFLVFILVALGSGDCNGDDKVSGKYKSIIFIQPSASDYPVNLHKEGGYVEFKLNADSSFEAKFFIPELSRHQLPLNEAIYKGTYNVDIDTLEISGTNSFLDNEIFILREGKLKMKTG